MANEFLKRLEEQYPERKSGVTKKAKDFFAKVKKQRDARWEPAPQEGDNSGAINLTQKVVDLLGLIPSPATAAGKLGVGVAGVIVRGSGKDAELAQTLLDLGKKNRDVFTATGHYKGPVDNAIKRVISDEGAELKKVIREGDQHRLFDILYHPRADEIRSVLPDLDRVIVRGKNLKGADGSYTRLDPHTGKSFVNIAPKATKEQQIVPVLHETTHGIQARSGFTQGNSHLNAINHRDFPLRLKIIGEAMQKNPDFAKTIQKAYPFNHELDAAADYIYRHSGGEAEARAVEKMFETGRFTDFPLDLYDVSLAHLIDPKLR